MQFNDFTLVGGDVYSRRRHDTTALAPPAVAVCARMLRLLRRGELNASQPIPDFPAFSVSLGPPAWLVAELGERVEARGLFFCVAAGSHPMPFQINLVLPAAGRQHDREVEERACGTVLALSCAPSQQEGLGRHAEERVEALMSARPLLATALVPVGPLDQETVMVAADFATCFAAAMLLESSTLDADAEMGN